MRNLNKKIGLSLATTLLLTTSAFAGNTSEISELKQQIQMLMKKTQELEKKSVIQEKKSIELAEQSQTLIDETSDLKTGFNYTKVDVDKTFSGLGPAASKVYNSKSPLSIGGYGEMYYSHYSEDQGSSEYTNKVDVYRFVPYIGYKFSDNIILNVELEFEHGGVDSDDGGEIIVEFMYLDFLINKNFNVRLGHMLVPMGLINEKHEPILFNTVQRPNTSKYLIPSTWHESGAMVFGEIAEGWNYKFSGTTGIDSSKTGNKWLRNGRGGSYVNTDPSLGLTARVDYTGHNGLLIGASAYHDTDIDMWDVHADYKIGGFRTYGVYTQSTRSNSSAFSAGYDQAIADGESISDANIAGSAEATDAQGGFINFSFDLLTLTNKTTDKLPVFVQFESVETRESVVSGSSLDTRDSTTIGINYFPHPQVVLKMDYVMQDSYESTPDTDIISASIGFVF